MSELIARARRYTQQLSPHIAEREAAHLISDLTSALVATQDALRELHALVWGESPGLLNEDSGGDARLDLRIRELTEKP